MLTIIGCGNLNRSDDGAGVVVAQRLRARLPGSAASRVRVFDAGTAGMEVMFQARGARALILVDASSSGSEPGAIFELPGQELASAPAPGAGLHAFRWNHALHAGKQIFREAFPDDVSVYLIEAESLAFGCDLSARVDRSVERVVERLIERVLYTVRVERGSFYLSAELYSSHFEGCAGVAALERQGAIAIAPLRQPGSGGLLLKVLNARGDRVIHAPELLRGLGVADTEEHALCSRWDAEQSALVLPLPPRALEAPAHEAH